MGCTHHIAWLVATLVIAWFIESPTPTTADPDIPVCNGPQEQHHVVVTWLNPDTLVFDAEQFQLSFESETPHATVDIQEKQVLDSILDHISSKTGRVQSHMLKQCSDEEPCTDQRASLNEYAAHTVVTDSDLVEHVSTVLSAAVEEANILHQSLMQTCEFVVGGSATVTLIHIQNHDITTAGANTDAEDLVLQRISAAVQWVKNTMSDTPPTRVQLSVVTSQVGDLFYSPYIAMYPLWSDGIASYSARFPHTWACVDAAAITQTGAAFALHEDAYLDGTSFNKAFTLTQLIRMSECDGRIANSLQAHLLSNGATVRVLSSNATDRSRMVAALKELISAHRAVLPVHVDAASVLPTPKLPIQSKLSERFSHTLASTRLESKLWNPDAPFMEELVSNGTVQVLKNTVVSTWPALSHWGNSLSALLNTISGDVLTNVKLSTHGRHMDADNRGHGRCSGPEEGVNMLVEDDAGRALGGCMFHTPDFNIFNMTKEELIEHVQRAQQCSPRYSDARLVYFSDITPEMHAELKPDEKLYLTSDDWMYRKQFVWISTGGSVTHTHFDQDYNVFVQLAGSKRFTFFPPSASKMLSPFPRIHPLWHKSKVDFDNPDLSQFPFYSHAEGFTVEVEAGDLLYIPPYYWHHVETTSPFSISLSTLSHDDTTRQAMNTIYNMDHKFDRLKHTQGKVFAMRLFLDMLVHEVIGNGPNETTRFFESLLQQRYSGLEHEFVDDPSICVADKPDKIPTSQHVYGDCMTDMRLVVTGFDRLQPEVRDTLLLDYIEEIVAEIIGRPRVLSFFKYCFQNQEYYVTDMKDPEHDLWEYSGDDDDDDDNNRKIDR
eukprot:m.126268 g.126268  ORF g.126268 m.126268 type:complete len:832 (-) comp13825_c0_seq1:10-2505(-)